MSTIISNTSPIQYLHQAGVLFLFPELFTKVCIPEAVVEEIEAGRRAGLNLPDVQRLPWIEIRKVQQRALLPLVTRLGQGEKEVLALGLESTEPLLVLDDRAARRHGALLALPFIGTLGVLLTGKEQGRLKSVRSVLDRLDALGFRLHPSTRESALRLSGE